MTGHTNYKVLRDRLRSSPEGRARVEERRKTMRIALALADLREALNVTQTQLANALEVSQANISRIEHEDDLQFSTVENYVAGLGGQLEVRVILPDKEPIDLMPLIALQTPEADTAQA
jgi:transcriptional regulator with XRE-family HTH domain